MLRDGEDLLPTGFAAAGRPLEIVCDESGYEGDKLIGTTTDVFAHASIRLDAESAAECVQELRRRIRSPATEYKANHLLREKHRAALEWLLGPASPLPGNAHVYLIDKVFFVVRAIAELLVGEPDQRAGTAPGRDGRTHAVATALYREGPRAFEPRSWTDFLVAANNLLRVKGRPEATTPIGGFFHAVDVLRGAGPGGRVGDILELFRRGRPRAEAFRARLLGEPATLPPLDPLVPAIVRVIVHWGAGGRPVSIAHDRQTTLSQERIGQLTELANEPDPARPGGRLAGLRFVHSDADLRVQVADILAGAARKIASDELNGRGDAPLTTLLRPYVDPVAIWGDDRSWSVLGAAR